MIRLSLRRIAEDIRAGRISAAEAAAAIDSAIASIRPLTREGILYALRQVAREDPKSFLAAMLCDDEVSEEFAEALIAVARAIEAAHDIP